MDPEPRDVLGLDEGIEFDAAGVEDFAEQVAALIERPGLVDVLDLPGGHIRFAGGLAALIEGFGGECRGVVVPPDPEPGNAHVLIPGTPIHVRLGGLSWHAVAVIVPLLASVLAMPAAGPPALWGLVALLPALRESVTVLTDRDKAVVVAVHLLKEQEGRPVSAEEVAEAVGESLEGVQKVLTGLSASRVLNLSDSGYVPAI